MTFLRSRIYIYIYIYIYLPCFDAEPRSEAGRAPDAKVRCPGFDTGHILSFLLLVIQEGSCQLLAKVHVCDEVLANRLRGLSLPRKSVVRLTDRPGITLDVFRGRKTTQQQKPCFVCCSLPTCFSRQSERQTRT